MKYVTVYITASLLFLLFVSTFPHAQVQVQAQEQTTTPIDMMAIIHPTIEPAPCPSCGPPPPSIITCPNMMWDCPCPEDDGAETTCTAPELPVNVPVVACQATMYNREITLANGLLPLFAYYNFWFNTASITNENPIYRILDGGPTGGRTGYYHLGWLQAWDTTGSSGAVAGDSPTNPNAAPVAGDHFSGQGVPVCQAVFAMFAYTDNWPAQTISYNIPQGPDSNTFAHNVGIAAGNSITVVAPTQWSPGWTCTVSSL